MGRLAEVVLRVWRLLAQRLRGVHLGGVRGRTIGALAELQVEVGLGWWRSLMQAMAVPVILDLVVQAFHGVLLGVGRAVAKANLVGLLLGAEHPLLLILKVLAGAGLIVEHRFVLAVVCSHLLGGACHVANGNAARPDLERGLPDVGLRLVGPSGRGASCNHRGVRRRGCRCLLRLVHKEHLGLAVLRGLVVRDEIRRARASCSAAGTSSFAIGSSRDRVLLQGLRELWLVLVHDGELLLLRGANLVVRMLREPVPLLSGHVLLACRRLVVASTAYALVMCIEVKLVEGEASYLVDRQEHALGAHLAASGLQSVDPARVRLLIHFPLHLQAELVRHGLLRAWLGHELLALRLRVADVALVQVSLPAVLIGLCTIPDILRLRMTASGRRLARLQHRYDLPAVVEVASMVLELARAARAVVG